MPDKPPTLVNRMRTKVQGLVAGVSVLSPGRQLTGLQQFVHFWILIAQSFIKNRLPVRAASLSYTTLLALVPMMAVAVGITSSLLKDQSEERIGLVVDRVVAVLVPADPDEASSRTSAPVESQESATNAPAPQATVVGEDADTTTPASTETDGEQRKPSVGSTLSETERARVAGYIKGVVTKVSGGAMGLIGTALVVAAAISMLIRIENAFNDVWGVQKGRTLFMRLVLYWTVITLVPLMALVATGLAGGPHFKATERLLAGIPLLGWLLFQLLPVVLLWLTFSTFYILMPNTRVRWQAAAVGGAVAALLWHLNNSLSAYTVSRVATYTKIYGSVVGTVPVLMIGLYFAWMILLFGGQVSYAWQNRVAYFQERLAETVNQRGREFVALRLMTMIAAAFQRGAPAPGLNELAEQLTVPQRLAQQILETLTAANLINEVSGAGRAFVPSRPIESISCHDVLEALRAGQGSDLVEISEDVRREVHGEFQQIYEAERKAAESISLLAMATRANTPALEAGASSRTPQVSTARG